MKHNIDELLERYWEGESSVDDENTLKAYFASNEVSPTHAMYSDLFGFFNDQAAIAYPSTNEPTVHRPVETTVKNLSIKRYIYAIAAVFVLTICSVVVMKNMMPEHTPELKASLVREIEDPEEALEVTKQALAMLSSNFRKSTQKVKENMGELEKASLFK